MKFLLVNRSTSVFGIGAVASIMALGGSAASVVVASPDDMDMFDVEEIRSLQQPTAATAVPTYSPTFSQSPTLGGSSANTAMTTTKGTGAGTASATTKSTMAASTATGGAASVTSTSSTVAMTGTSSTMGGGGSTSTTEATGSSMSTTTGAASTSDSESWMVCQKDLATMTSLNMDTLTLYHYVALAPDGDSRGGILCAWLERDDGTDGWIGFGMSPTGEMDDGIGMVGLPDDGTVEKYWLYGESPYVERMADDKQTLMFTSISQDSDGTTRMEFAKFLNEENELPILANGDNTFLFALGSSNELGYHSSGMSSFTLDLKTPEASGTTTTSATSSGSTSGSIGAITTSATSSGSTSVSTGTSSTTFSIDATLTTSTTPSDEESSNSTLSTTAAPMEFASGSKSTESSAASTISSVMHSMSWALALCALFKF